MVIIGHNKKVSFNVFLVCLLFIVDCTFCQSTKGKIDILKLLSTELERHLFPPFVTKDTCEIILFTIKPEAKPDASFRIINICKKFYLEVRILDQNVWVELLTSINKHSYCPLSIKTHYYLIPVSKNFENKMVDVFSKVNASKDNQVKIYSEGKITLNKFDVFDGSLYGFSVYLDGKKQEKRILLGEKDPYNTESSESSDYIYKVKLTNVKIINDVINGTFNESKYEIYK